MPLPSTVEPVLGPTPPAASPPGSRWPRTSLSSSLRRRGRTFSVGAGWPAPVDRAVGHVGQRQCGARRSLARIPLGERPCAPRFVVGGCSPR